MNHRPSSLPMLAQCPRFESDSTSFAEEGRARHGYLAEAVTSKNLPFDLTANGEDEDIDAIQWAVDYIQLNAPLADYPLEIEQRRSWIGPDFGERQGTPDFVCGPVIIDFKWRYRDYAPQMADYALERMDAGHEAVTVHLLFGADRRVEKIVFTRDQAEKIVGNILRRADSNAGPEPCDYCGWCAKRLTCPVVLERVNAVVEGRIDWGLDTYHSSEISDAKQMGKALAIARLVKKWAESVEHHSKEMTKRGDVPDGYKKQEKRGKRFVTSVADAFGKAGVPQDEFLKACTIKFSDLVKIHTALNGMKKASAEREMSARLGDTLQRKPPGFSLVSIKTQIDEEEDGGE